MKPFGIRLAAGAITILLGALAAVQAQKDRKSNPDSTWSVADAAMLNTPPAPISTVDDEGWNSGADAAPAFAALSNSFKTPANQLPDEPQDPIQLVQHTDQDSALPTAPGFAAAPPSFGMPPVGVPPLGMPPVGDAPKTEGFPAPQPTPAKSNFADFDPSKLPGAISAAPATADTRPAASGWEMPAMGDATPAHPAPGTDGPAPAMTMGAATLAMPSTRPDAESMDEAPTAMPELQFEGPPADENDSYAMPAGPSFGGGNALRSEPAPMFAPPPVSLAPVSALAPNGRATPSLRAAESLPQLPQGLPATQRIASLPAAAPLPVYAASEISNQTINSPGDRRLEGVQSPSVVIHKRAPSEVKVGQEASFVVHIQNVGSAEALDVRVHDRVPAGMRLIDTSPAASVEGDALLWQLGALPVGEERTITMLLVPEQEGELGSVARVTFEAAASVRTISTRPQLQIVQRAPAEVRIGQQLEIELEVSNPGTGDAVGVILQTDVPEGLEHPQGRQLDNVLGTLRAGEVRRQILRLRAVAPGVIQNVVRLTSEEGLTAEHVTQVEVVAPELQLELTGPSRKYLERQATYQLDIANVGTDDATNVEIIAYLDRGFTFVSTGKEGHYDPTQHAVHWSLAQFPEGKKGQVPLTILPVQEGEHTIRLEARGDLGLTATSQRSVTVEALAELSFQISDAADPIEIGSETTYEIRLMNRGSRGDSNVQVRLELPTGLELISTEQDAQQDDRGNVVFSPQPQLEAGRDLVYRVKVRGVAEGTHLTKAIVVSDQSSVPVTKEESTMVYADR